MNIRGSRTLDAPRAAVFAAICDPDVLLAVIPGCDEIERIGDDGVPRSDLAAAPGRGRHLPDRGAAWPRPIAPSDRDARGRGRRRAGLDRRATRRSASPTPMAGPPSTTTGPATIGGPLARLDSRFVEGLAGSLVAQGLDRLDARLQLDRTSGTAAASPTVSGEARR